jgi:hypothetical protein
MATLTRKYLLVWPVTTIKTIKYYQVRHTLQLLTQPFWQHIPLALLGLVGCKFTFAAHHKMRKNIGIFTHK